MLFFNINLNGGLSMLPSSSINSVLNPWVLPENPVLPTPDSSVVPTETLAKTVSVATTLLPSAPMTMDGSCQMTIGHSRGERIRLNYNSNMTVREAIDLLNEQIAIKFPGQSVEMIYLARKNLIPEDGSEDWDKPFMPIANSFRMYSAPPVIILSK